MLIVSARAARREQGFARRRDSWYNDRVKKRYVILLAALLLWPCMAAAQKQMYLPPSRDQMQRACERTGGKWEPAPEWCDNLHARTWKKLDAQQRHLCQDRFHEPCECGIGRRFMIYNRLGCIKSNFPEDYWED